MSAVNLISDTTQDDPKVEILGQVELRSFTASPDVISPFGSSALSWSVDVPPGGGGVTVKLNGLEVPRVGSRVVQPRASQTYLLSASLGNASKRLGSVAVGVNLSRCLDFESGVVDEFIAAALLEQIKARGDVHFRPVIRKLPKGQTVAEPGRPVVTIEPGRIRFVMKLEQNDFPNADIDIDASFGLAVVSTGLGVSITDVGTRMIPVGADVDVDVSAAFPWNIAFRSRLRQAEKSTEASMRESIPKLVDRVIAPLFDAFTMPDHFSLQNVNIFVVQGLGAVTATYCKSLPDIVSPGPAVNG